MNDLNLFVNTEIINGKKYITYFEFERVMKELAANNGIKINFKGDWK